VLAGGQEGMQQLLIAVLMALLRDQRTAKMTNAGGQCGTTHDGFSGSRTRYLYLVVPARHNSIAPRNCTYPSLKRQRRNAFADASGSDTNPLLHRFDLQIAQIFRLPWLDREILRVPAGDCLLNIRSADAQLVLNAGNQALDPESAVFARINSEF